MGQTPAAVTTFLAGKRIAVAGVSRQPAQAANAVFRKLKNAGYDVFPVNPNATEVEGVVCYRTLADVPGALDGVVIATTPQASMDVVRQCAERGVKHVWFHRSFGEGSVSDASVRECEAHGIESIVGGCPLMFLEPDFGHSCMKWWLQRSGRVPR